MKLVHIVIGFALSLAACAEGVDLPRSPAQEATDRRDFSAALSRLRDRLRADPDDPGALEAYYSTVEQAEAYYLDRARGLRLADNFAEAEGLLGRAILLVPESTILREALDRVSDARDARGLYRDARVAARLGRRDKAIELAEAATRKDPEYGQAAELLKSLYAEQPGPTDIKPIRLSTGAPVTINFQDARFKDAVLALGRAYGVNTIFDAELPDRRISVYADGVAFQQALQLLLKSNAAFYRRIGKNSIIVASDTAEKRAEYEDYRVRTFFVRSGRAQDIADILTETLELETVSVNEDENSITVRDTPERLQLADQLVSAQDRTPAEVIMEVEVLEVNRTKSEELGLEFGSQITVTPPQLTAAEIFPVRELGERLGTTAIVLPAATFRFFKQDVDARTLASPRIRALNRVPAEFHVGDEVPLRATEIVEDTGQTRTTFEYRDVGVRLNVTPEVRLNSSVSIELRLEVSTLGQNLGTSENPAFVIGTRKVETRMLLEDGETAIIGGLIREEDRTTKQRVPGLGRIAALGQLFEARNSEAARTDIILTLTPRVVRARDLPGFAESDFFSGTGARVSSSNPNDFVAGPVDSETPTIRLDLSGAVPEAEGRIPLPSPEGGAAEAPADGGAAPVLSFERDSYSVAEGDEIRATVTASGFSEGTSGMAIIRFRSDIVEARDVDTRFNLPAQIDNQRGEVRIELTPQLQRAAGSEIATVTFRGVAPGRSYLIFGNAIFGSAAGGSGAQDLPDNTALQNSEIVVQ